ncbi:MAG TPA: DinB family protein [Blastocatellia bacterium]|nr:DinB family protein [Blastocatellia bacterium]
MAEPAVPEPAVPEPKTHSYSIPAPATPQPAGVAFVRHARFRLKEDYRVKIGIALGTVTDEEVWWHPNDASNSIGNLLLHLTGNVRQWLGAGLGGAPDLRDRPREFTEAGAYSKSQLLAMLDQALAEADGVLARIESEQASSGSDRPLQALHEIQGFRQTALDAVFHVVEHFSYHTGQIICLAKAKAVEEIRLYDERALAGKKS